MVLNTSNLNKHDTKKLNIKKEKNSAEINGDKNLLNTALEFYKSEAEAMDNLILSFKSAKCKKDDF
jgi:hypothetical protein